MNGFDKWLKVTLCLCLASIMVLSGSVSAFAQSMPVLNGSMEQFGDIHEQMEQILNGSPLGEVDGLYESMREQWEQILVEEASNFSSSNDSSSPAEEAPTADEQLQQEEALATDGELQQEETDYSNQEEAYFRGMQLEKEGNIYGAIEAFVASEGYADAVVHIAPHLEEYACAMMDAEEYRKAQAALILCSIPELNDLLAECNDYCFLLDLADGLAVRWENAEQDTSVMSDKKIREYYRSLVNDELGYLGKYMQLPFFDSKLAELAFSYLGSLQNQLVGLEYYGEDSKLYNEYWVEKGQNLSLRTIYLLNRKFGIEVDPAYAKTFKSTIQNGKKQDVIASVNHMLYEQIRHSNLNFQDMGISPMLVPFSFHNTCGYDLNLFNVKVRCYDDHNSIVFDQYFGTWTDFEAESTVDTYSLPFMFPFARFEIAYEYNVRGEGFDTGNVYGSVAPIKQWSWNGKTIKSNDPQSAIPAFAAEDIKSFWQWSESSINKLYVPAVRFALRNTSTVDADQVTVRCVFVDKDTKVVWDEVVGYVVPPFSTPLKAGYAHEVVLYSRKGYDQKTRDVPSLVAEIYVNNEPLDSIDIIL